MVDLQVLATEVAKPEYAPYRDTDPNVVVAMFNDPTTTMVKSRFASARTVLAEVGPAGAVALSKLKGFANSAPPSNAQAAALHASVVWAMTFITDESGIDVGHSTTRDLLDALVTATVITAAEAAALKDLALQPASRSEELFGIDVRVTYDEVVAANAMGA